MADVHHFTYGAFNPVAAYLLAFLGSFLGLLCTVRARDAHNRGRRNRWLIIAAFSIGGGAIWLMHFAAMLGFDVPDSPVRYSAGPTMLSLGLAVITVGAGLIVVGHGRRSVGKTIVAGTITGLGVLAMHYTGMEGLHVAGNIHYRPLLVVASGLIAITASTVALWFTIAVRGWLPVTGAAALMGVAVCGMHYTGMAAMTVHLDPLSTGVVNGLRPMVMLIPITLLTSATILGVAFSALQAMTEEEFTDGAGIPRRGAHAEPQQPWSLKQASASALRRTAGSRPSPRPSRPAPARPTPARPPVPEEALQPANGG